MVVPERLWPTSPPLRSVGVLPVEEVTGLPVENDAVTSAPRSPTSPPAASVALAVVPFAVGCAWEYDALTSPSWA